MFRGAFCLFRKHDVYFKEYPETFFEVDLQRESELNKFLLSQKFATDEFLEDKNGNVYHFANGRYVVLREYIEGESYTDHNLTDGSYFRQGKYWDDCTSSWADMISLQNCVRHCVGFVISFLREAKCLVRYRYIRRKYDIRQLCLPGKTILPPSLCPTV